MLVALLLLCCGRLPHGAVGWFAVCDCGISRQSNAEPFIKYITESIFSSPAWVDPENSCRGMVQTFFSHQHIS